MQVIAEKAFTVGATTYHLRKGHIHLGGGNYSKKAVYELSHTTSQHGSSRDEIIRVLAQKFEIEPKLAERIIDAFDAASLKQEDERRPRIDPGAPVIPGGGLPKRPLGDQGEGNG